MTNHEMEQIERFKRESEELFNQIDNEIHRVNELSKDIGGIKKMRNTIDEIKELNAKRKKLIENLFG